MLALYLRIRNWFENEDGQDLIEYALIAGLIAIVAVISITAAGSSVSDLFSTVAASIP
jgi:pilus assembly protein Flp/PilA